jgi:hypothetical protein
MRLNIYQHRLIGTSFYAPFHLFVNVLSNISLHVYNESIRYSY